jgi:hypothetical protein
MKDYVYVFECMSSEIRGYFKAKNDAEAAAYVEKRYQEAIKMHGAFNRFFRENKLTKEKKAT